MMLRFQLSRIFLLIAFASQGGIFPLLPGQNLPFEEYFQEAYAQFPTLPPGLLESVAWTNTRIRHLKATPSCQELPEYHGVMGLVKDGKGYFQNSLEHVAGLSGYTEAEIMASPRMSILAYAKAYASLQQNKRLTSGSVESHRSILSELSELPLDSDPQSQYALDQQYFMILREIEAPHYQTNQRTPRSFKYDQIFGAENYRVLSAARVTVSTSEINSDKGAAYSAPGNRNASCTASSNQTNFAGAVWNAAHSNNYSSRGGAKVDFVTIHTIQGSYASAIAWFRNARSKVSTHYVIRASDGQITQMVCELEKAFHVKTDNAEAIGIEHEGFIDDGGAWYTNEMYESSAALVRDICTRYSINPLQTFGGPPTSGVLTLTNNCYKIKGHQHFRGNNHIDPGPYWDWDRYYRLVNPSPKPTIFTAKKGELTDSGGTQGNYADQDRRTYLIRPAGATKLELEFAEFDLEGTSAKPYDYLDIFDGLDENGRYLGRFTGKVLPGKLTAQSGAVYMEFRSDCQVNHKGWRIKYKSFGKQVACESPTNLLANNLFALGGTLNWEGDAERYVVEVKRRNEPTSIRYLVQEPQLVVTGLKSNAVYQWQVQAVCGNDSSAVAGASFVTPSLMGRGSSPQIFTVRSSQGRFYDSGGLDAGYSNDENFAYRIVSPVGGRIQLNFTGFETEKDLDVLTIYDGNNFSSRMIGQYSGTESPRQVVSTGSEMLLHFRSDAATNAAGWAASWTVVGGQAPVTPPPTTPSPSLPGNPRPTPPAPQSNPPTTGTIPNAEPFTLALDFPAAAPSTLPQLETSYRGKTTIRFSDQDRSGRGFANRFYNLSEKSAQGWRSRPQAGFFFDDFNGPLQSQWTASTGNWSTAGDRLVQTDATQANGNLYAELRQTEDRIYVYHWQARMSGPGANRRHGLHFFASNPEQEERGTSYFVWIRDTDGDDQVEIYKTVDNKFDLKATRKVSLEAGQVYDFKAIYNPGKGRIEVYVNNQFSGAWVDPSPIKTGKGISLRTGACQLELDNLIVYQNRGASVEVAVGGSLDPLSGNKPFLVSSLVVDRRINWSRVGQAESQTLDPTQPVPPGPQPTTPQPTPQPTPPPVVPPTPPSASVVTTLPSVLESPVRWRPSGEGQSYYLASQLSGQEWQANGSQGAAWDDFTRLRPGWVAATGSWEIRFGTVQQTNAMESNSNLYLPVTQIANQAYVYRFKTRLLTAGENKRFGLHLLASSPAGPNRGNSYLVWFRHSDSGPDKVEIYRATANQMPIINAEAIVEIKPLDWYEMTVLTEPATNTISVWMNNYPVLTWQDPEGLHAGGNAISFRTGNAQVQFDDLKIFQAVPSDGAWLDTEKVFTEKSRGNTPSARLLWIRRDGRGWAKEEEATAVIR